MTTKDKVEKPKMGRKKLSDLDKAKSRASRNHKKYLATITDEFKIDLEKKQMQYNNSENRMGRPPKKLYVIQENAITAYKDALKEYRALEKAAGISPISEEEIVEFKKNDNAGRLAKDEVIALMKLIRRTEAQLTDAQNEDESKFEKPTGAGRPSMTKSEKILHYRNKLLLAKEDLKEMLSKKSASEVIYYELFDLKNVRRAINTEANALKKLAKNNTNNTDSTDQENSSDISNKLSKLESELRLINTAIRAAQIDFDSMKLKEDTAEIAQKEKVDSVDREEIKQRAKELKMKKLNSLKNAYIREMQIAAREDEAKKAELKLKSNLASKRL